MMPCTKRIQKRPPTHPGVILKYGYMEPLQLSVTKLAEYLGVSRITVSKIINERAPVSPEMALRLSKTFNTTPDLWAGLQNDYDLWHAAHHSTEWQKAQPIEPDEFDSADWQKIQPAEIAEQLSA